LVLAYLFAKVPRQGKTKWRF